MPNVNIRIELTEEQKAKIIARSRQLALEYGSTSEVAQRFLRIADALATPCQPVVILSGFASSRLAFQSLTAIPFVFHRPKT